MATSTRRAHGYPDLRTAISEHQRRFDMYVDPAAGSW